MSASCLHIVIASEAKQSIAPQEEDMDCFVASLPAQRFAFIAGMTVVAIPRQDFALSRKYGSTGPCTLIVSGLP